MKVKSELGDVCMNETTDTKDLRNVGLSNERIQHFGFLLQKHSIIIAQSLYTNWLTGFERPEQRSSTPNCTRNETDV